MIKIEKNDDYWNRAMCERINSVALGDNLCVPPVQFSENAKKAWLKDVEQYANGISGRLGFWIEGFDGPYDVKIELAREQGKKSHIEFCLTSLADEGGRTIKIDAASVRKDVAADRELVVSLSEIFKQNSDLDMHVIAQVDAQKKWHHARAAAMLMDLFEKQGASCRSLDFFKNLFALLRVTLPLDEKMTASLARMYDRTPDASMR